MPPWQHLYAGDFAKGGNIYKIASDGSHTIYAQGCGSVTGLAFDPDGTLYACGGDSIWKVTPTSDGSPATKENGHVVAFASGLHHSWALTRDGEGHLWMTEYFVKELLDENGKSFPKKQFEPGGLYRFAPDGTKTTIDAPLVWPYGLTTGPDGHIYLASLGKMSIFQYTLTGEKSLVADKINWLRNTVFDSQGNIFALGADGITKIAPDRTRTFFHKHKAGENKHPVGLAFDANGSLYSSDVRLDKSDNNATGHIYQYAADGTRTIFSKVGYSPFYLAFYPTTPPATEDQGKKK